MRSSGWPPVNTSDARAALEAEGLSFARVEPVAEQGWASWTFELDGSHIVRFPRRDDIVAAMQREMRLLPALAAHVSFRVPEPLHSARDWFVYEKIHGRAFDAGDDVDAALAMIEELHTFPVEEATRLLGRPSIDEHFAMEWAVFSDEAFPHLDDDLRSRVEVLRPPPDVAPVLIHNDLGPEHVLVDDSGTPVGIIDFEDAIVGDPACDLMPMTVLAGRPLTWAMWRYHCRSTLHAIVHHVREGEAGELAGVVAELRRRLDLEPGR